MRYVGCVGFVSNILCRLALCVCAFSPSVLAPGSHRASYGACARFEAYLRRSLARVFKLVSGWQWVLALAAQGLTRGACARFEAYLRYSLARVLKLVSGWRPPTCKPSGRWRKVRTRIRQCSVHMNHRGECRFRRGSCRASSSGAWTSASTRPSASESMRQVPLRCPVDASP